MTLDKNKKKREKTGGVSTFRSGRLELKLKEWSWDPMID